VVDALLDGRVRREHAALSYLQTRHTVLARVENGIAEPGDNGVAATLLKFRSSWQDLANDPGSDAARQQVLAAGATLARALHAQATNVAGEEADQRTHLVSIVGEVNTAATDVAALNRTIRSLEVNGGDAGVLRDRRDQLALRLAELTGATTSVQSDGTYDVVVAGRALVDGGAAGAMAVVSGVTPTGDSDGAPVTFSITVDGGTTPVVATALSGELGAVSELLNTTLPGYREGLDAITRDLADAVNAQHTSGFDRTGAPGGAYFTFDPDTPASSLSVAIDDPALVAASAVPGTLDGSIADALGSTRSVDGAYQRLVNGFGSEVAALQRRSANQAALTGSVDAAREQDAGVNLDEEMVNMVTAQRAYEAAARLLTAIDEVMDTLINRTGIVGR